MPLAGPALLLLTTRVPDRPAHHRLHRQVFLPAQAAGRVREAVVAQAVEVAVEGQAVEVDNLFFDSLLNSYTGTKISYLKK